MTGCQRASKRERARNPASVFDTISAVCDRDIEPWDAQRAPGHCPRHAFPVRAKCWPARKDCAGPFEPRRPIFFEVPARERREVAARIVDREFTDLASDDSVTTPTRERL